MTHQEAPTVKVEFIATDLTSEQVRTELLGKLVGKTVSVKRTSGAVEADWYVRGIALDGIVVARQNPGAMKKVSLASFAEHNKDLVEGL